MLSTNTSENGFDPKEAKQWIKNQLASSLKALQKRYVTSDTVVTSEDRDANSLCCVLEAVFIHGLKTKYIKSDVGGKGKKRMGWAPLPQPVFWALLKSITHRDVITELEHLNFINSDVGRCRAWVRLAVNDSLMECYLTTLLREKSLLCEFYQLTAFLLDSEECEVLLSYLQGLTSLMFHLSYKSAVLNEWTTTPLALAGLCPGTDLEPHVKSGSSSYRKESFDSSSQSSESEIIEVHHSRAHSVIHDKKNAEKSNLTSSMLSLDTTSSSQLSSSISSDSLLQANDAKSPDKCTEESWSCDFDVGMMGAEDSSRSSQEILDEFSRSTHTPDSEKEDSAMQCDPEELQGDLEKLDIQSNTLQPVDSPELMVHCTNKSTQGWDAESSKPNQNQVILPQLLELSQDKPKTPSDQSIHAIKCDVIAQTKKTAVYEGSNSGGIKKEQGENESLGDSAPTSPEFFPKSSNWISEEDFYKPYPKAEIIKEEQMGTVTNKLLCNGNGTVSMMNTIPSKVAHKPSPDREQKNFSVVHRRQIGLSNPFRGLLKLGNLEKRGAMGIWKEFYCELTPYEFRLCLDSEDRVCSENCSLLKCESVGPAHSDGRFELHLLTGKKVHLRAPSQDEADDWVDRLREAVNKCRPQKNENWEILQVPNSSEEVDPSLQGSHSNEPLPYDALDWSHQTDADLDAIKESVLYTCTENKVWTPFVFSLSLEALKCYRIRDQEKVLCNIHKIKTIRDVIPDTSLGSLAYFRVLTSKTTLKLQAENAEEAKSWRVLIRKVLTSYLETAEDPESTVSQDGSCRKFLEHSLQGDGLFLQYLTVVPRERGLDAQGFKCAGCFKLIGVSFCKPKLCAFSGLYYCDMCQGTESAVIPARILHSWDLTRRPICKQALKFLHRIQNEPLISVESVNQSLYKHVEQMAQIHRSREKLKLLGEYLVTCRSGAIKTLHKCLQDRTFLLESPHLYSVVDIWQVADGTFEAFLQAAILFATDHVYYCDLCTQRGFICQLCNRSDIIFPFQFETTIRCKKCKMVFHSLCMPEVFSCPRCVRRQKYLERELQE
uniref:Pleckstrin homology and RUN domain containing M1 n=1 Tax=Latimeria chalumnae TaxID=7897 RepID=H3AA51_LATCH